MWAPENVSAGGLYFKLQQHNAPQENRFSVVDVQHFPVALCRRINYLPKNLPMAGSPDEDGEIRWRM
jgi:hypothetical protein